VPQCGVDFLQPIPFIPRIKPQGLPRGVSPMDSNNPLKFSHAGGGFHLPRSS
jgi:hypothetical protein